MNSPFPKPDYALATQYLIGYLAHYLKEHPETLHLKFPLKSIYCILKDEKITQSPVHLQNILQMADHHAINEKKVLAAKLFKSYIIDNQSNTLSLEINDLALPTLLES